MSSEWQSRILAGVWILLGIGLAGLAIADVPPISWINDWQGQLLGFYSVKLTLILVVLLAALPVLILKGIWNAIRGTPPETEEPARHPAMLPPQQANALPRSRPRPSSPRRRPAQDDDDLDTRIQR